MALTEAQILNALVLLGLPARIDVAAGYTGGDGKANRASAVARKLLEQLNADQEAEVSAILTAYSAVKLDADTIKAEGLDSSPARTRARLRRALASMIGFTHSGATSGGVQLVRG